MRCVVVLLCSAFALSATAAEVTVKNDSLVDMGTGTVQAGFIEGEKAASWLTSPCDGNIVAVQVYWSSFAGGTGQVIQEAIDISRAGTFPTPGAVAETLVWPLLTDGWLNEFRFLDDDSTIPLQVPVAANETFVVSVEFQTAPTASGASVVNDSGAQPNRNAIYADIGGTFVWFSNTTLGVNGDWVIRAVIDCPVAGNTADVGVTLDANLSEYVPGGALTYTINVSNQGPAASPQTTIIDTFPAALTNVSWACAGSAGGACASTNGSGGILAQVVNLPMGGSVTYTINGTVQTGTTGALSNSVSAVTGGVVSFP